jgi:type II secretory pathway pseudopilin PulG
MKITDQKGVSLVILTVAVILMIIITTILVYNAQTGVKVKALNQMYNDVQTLSDKIATYYSKNGAIPASIEYNNTEVILNIKNSNQLSPNDNDNYYIIDLSAIENLSLNYGRDYETTNSDNANNKTDIYIINEQSHHIYYVKGIALDGVTYYTNDLDDEINLYFE